MKLLDLIKIFFEMNTTDKLIIVITIFSIIPLVFLFLNIIINKIKNELKRIKDEVSNELKKDEFHPCQSQEYRKVQDKLIDTITDNQTDLESILNKVNQMLDNSKSEKYDFFTRMDKVFNELDNIKRNNTHFSGAIDSIKDFLMKINAEFQSFNKNR
jgi:predicted PurR-regulated permease PerM